MQSYNLNLYSYFVYFVQITGMGESQLLSALQNKFDKIEKVGMLR